MRRPKAEQKHEKWQTAVAVLIMAAEGRGPLMHARIGVLKALLNRNVERVFTGRKDHHWGNRKLARDGDSGKPCVLFGGLAVTAECRF